MKEHVRQALGWCISLAFRDTTWQFFGFSRRPKHGAFWNRFRPSWRVILERKLFAEIFITNVAACIVSGALDSDDLNEMIRFFLKDTRVKNLMGYRSSELLQNVILKYAATPVKDWPSILMERLPINSITNKKLFASVVLACSQFSRVALYAIEAAKDIIKPAEASKNSSHPPASSKQECGFQEIITDIEFNEEAQCSEEKYDAVLPMFSSVFVECEDNHKSVQEFSRFFINIYGRGVLPYLTRFIVESKAMDVLRNDKKG